MKRLPFRSVLTSAASLAALATLAACGGISDPTKGSNESIATVSGALTGTAVPAGAHVALVWKIPGTDAFAVTGDVPVVDGKFTMQLTVPANEYFFSAEETSDTVTEELPTPEDPPLPGTAPSTPPPDRSGGGGSAGGGTPTPGESFAFAGRLSPRDTVSGGISQPLEAAVAGFVVYVDANGNGKLDLDTKWATSTDQILGGNDELLLAYLRNGGALDYEKMRDKAGVAPHAGYNLVWQGERRWLPLNVVELKLKSNIRLPSAVCYGGGGTAVSDDPAPQTSTGGEVPSDPDQPNGYPSPDDPNLTCLDGGWTYSYTPPSTPCGGPTNEDTPPSDGLCSSSYNVETPGCVSPRGYSQGLKPGSTVPEGWPCPIAGNDVDAGLPQDGGSAPDAGK